MEQHKKLYLLRHATAEPKINGKQDFNRCLSSIGRKETDAFRLYLQRHKNINPEIILCSKAKRCQQTLQEIKGCFSQSHVILHHFLYLSSAYTVLEVLGFLDDSVNTVLIVGHEKAIIEMLNFFIKDKQIRAQIFPKGCICTTFAGFDFPQTTRWQDITFKSARIENIFYP